jgi:hypothetical protein
MKPTQQFFALLRYHVLASPWIVLIPLAFGVQPVLILSMGSNWNSLMTPMSSLTMLTVTPIFVASLVFAAEKIFAGTPGTTAQTNLQSQSYSPDFLLTRAIDRPILFRARSVVYWLLIILPFLVLLGMAIWKPALEIEMPLKLPNRAEYYLSHLPGAEIVKTTKSTQVVGSSYGNIGLAASMILFCLAAAAIWQAVVFSILKLPFRKVIVFGVFFASIASGPFLMRRGGDATISNSEVAVIWVMNHFLVSAVIVLGLAVASYFYCAARDRQLEYP